MTERLTDFLGSFYSGTTPGNPINTTGTSLIKAGKSLSGGTVDTVHALDGSRLGLGAGNDNSVNNFGGSGKSFSELSAGTGWGGILGILGLGATDAAKAAGLVDAGTADATTAAITDAGPAGVEASAGGVFDAFTGAVPRFAIIILGFIFVAVGLSMFKNPVQMAVAAVVPP